MKAAKIAAGVASFGLAGALCAVSNSALESSAFAADGPTKPPGRKDPGCIYGQVIDGHTGALRCLSPSEPAPRSPVGVAAEAADAGADAAVDASALRREAGIDAAVPVPLRPGGESDRAPSRPSPGGESPRLSVSIEGLTFESGEVPRAAASLERMKKDFAKCGPSEPNTFKEGSVEIRFLVRAPGRAEGVDVVQSRGVSADIVRCVASSLAGRSVGAPTSDPVGVAMTVRFKKD